jgi:hypothetical protein
MPGKKLLHKRADALGSFVRRSYFSHMGLSPLHQLALDFFFFFLRQRGRGSV